MKGATPGGVIVRRAVEKDLDDAADLQWRWRVEEWDGEPEIDRAGFTTALRGWALARPATHPGFVASIDGVIVGMGWLATIERVPTPIRVRRRHGLVQSVYVLPEVRDRGVGAALLQALIEESRRLGLEALLVHPSERSFPFYRRHGFSGSGEFLELRLAPKRAGQDMSGQGVPASVSPSSPSAR